MRRRSEQQYDSEKTSVMTVYGNGETQAHFYLDAQVNGIVAGKTYKLTWKQKGHHAPSYFIYAVDFAVGGGSTVGALTGQNGYTNYTAWQDREIQFTVSSVATNGSPRLRIDFSNGCDDFWLDDVKLCEVGKTVNIIGNGNFEYGASY